MTGTAGLEDGGLIILIAPEILGQDPDPGQLRSATTRAGRSIRLLVRITQESQIAFAEAIDNNRGVTELLIAASVPKCGTRLRCTQMPAGSNESEFDEIALAMSDVVLVQSKAANVDLLRRANGLGKSIIEPAGQMPSRHALPDLTRGIDPSGGFWPRVGSYFFGRFSECILALLAFDLFDSRPSGLRQSWSGLRRCFSLKGCAPPAAYCGFETLTASLDEVSAPARLQAYLNRFAPLDRSAVYGSLLHHDINWVTHCFSALAVAEAVAGSIWEGGSAWPIAEFVTLAIIVGLIYITRRSRLQDRWTACRFGAEYLRITIIYLGFLLIPRLLLTSDPSVESDLAVGPDLHSAMLRGIKATVRDYGLPHLGFIGSPRDSIKRLHDFAHDQLHYHDRNHARLERAEKRLRHLNGLIFLTIMAAVVYEIAPICRPVEHGNWLLFFTAVGPAIAAAFHGASTRVGIAHRAASSETSERELRTILKGLADMLAREQLTPADWPEAREFAKRAMAMMERDIAAGLGNSRLQPDSLPA